MKRLSFFLLSSFLFASGLLMQGCKEQEQHEQLLVVERQSLTFNLGDSTESRHITFDVDVPVAGPKVLTDSVMALLNEILHENCEALLDKPLKTLDEVRTDDVTNLLQHYAEIYEPFLEEDYSSYYDLTIEMLEQNTSFITYGVGILHCGASCGSELYCYTLSKKDGHRLSGAMTSDNYNRYLKKFIESSELRELMGSVPEIDYHPDFVGLLGDSVLFIVNGLLNHYTAQIVDFNEIKPYLTDEAQQMINEASAGDKVAKNEWYVGKKIGEVKTTSDKTISLFEYDPDPQSLTFGDFELKGENGNTTIVLRAFSQDQGKNVPENVFESGSAYVSKISFQIPNGAWARPDKIDGYYDFDTTHNELYVMALREPFVAHLLVYQFDGQHFTNTGKTIEAKQETD